MYSIRKRTVCFTFHPESRSIPTYAGHSCMSCPSTNCTGGVCQEGGFLPGRGVSAQVEVCTSLCWETCLHCEQNDRRL